MFPVGLTSAVKCVTNHSWWMPFVEKANDYFNLSRRKYLIVESTPNGFGVIPIKETEPFQKTILKVLSYSAALYSLYAVTIKKDPLDLKKVTSLMIPLIAFTVNRAFQAVWNLYPMENIETLFLGENLRVGQQRLLKDNTPLLEIPFDQVVYMECDKVAQLKIQLPTIRRNHNLPQKSNRHYRVPPTLYRGKSSLEVYKESIFDVRFMGRYDSETDQMVDNYYEIIRRRDSGLLFIDSLREVTITLDQLIALKLVTNTTRDGSRSSWFKCCSILPEYGNSVFLVHSKDNRTYGIKRIDSQKSISYNQMTYLYPHEFSDFGLQYYLDSEPLVWKAEQWHSYQNWDLFPGCTFLVCTRSEPYRVVKMLQPQSVG